jgi:hypothetical protein
MGINYGACQSKSVKEHIQLRSARLKAGQGTENQLSAEHIALSVDSGKQNPSTTNDLLDFAEGESLVRRDQVQMRPGVKLTDFGGQYARSNNLG